MTTPCVEVVIVNWNAGPQLRECVDSIIEHGNALVSRIIIVDNGSMDGSDRAVDGLAKVTLIRAGENLGFGKACNLGAAQGTSEFLLFLNPDAQLFAESLAPIVEFMQRPENSRVGICGAQLIDEDGHLARSCARFPSIKGFVARSAGLDRIFPGLGHFETKWDHASDREVDQLIGAFFFIRRSVFDALRGFDERFFLYYEDLDLAYRAKQAGWRSVYLAGARAFHAGGGVTKQAKASRIFYSLRSRILYVFKHFDPVASVVVLLATIVVEPASRSILAIFSGSWSALRETWMAYAMLIRWLPRGLAGRTATRAVE